MGNGLDNVWSASGYLSWVLPGDGLGCVGPQPSRRGSRTERRPAARRALTGSRRQRDHAEEEQETSDPPSGRTRLKPRQPMPHGNERDNGHPKNEQRIAFAHKARQAMASEDAALVSVVTTQAGRRLCPVAHGGPKS
jgi:hypothetical protein